eukprot:TRINITY_DN539_c0_g1_i11.p1 TRINITY_DN539_c0_g1~~TRINITY_DN539_c0_g1_i11.p1  ORF type:complete len:149 (+),score=25.72 TRINITY_DN539_c0_g1_i11:28-447(+)
MIRRPPRSTRKESSAASDVYKRQVIWVAVSARRRKAVEKEAAAITDVDMAHLLDIMEAMGQEVTDADRTASCSSTGPTHKYSLIPYAFIIRSLTTSFSRYVPKFPARDRDKRCVKVEKIERAKNKWKGAKEKEGGEVLR